MWLSTKMHWTVISINAVKNLKKKQYVWMEKNETTKDDKAFEVNFAKKFFFFVFSCFWYYVECQQKLLMIIIDLQIVVAEEKRKINQIGSLLLDTECL